MSQYIIAEHIYLLINYELLRQQIVLNEIHALIFLHFCRETCILCLNKVVRTKFDIYVLK